MKKKKNLRKLPRIQVTMRRLHTRKDMNEVARWLRTLAAYMRKSDPMLAPKFTARAY